MPSPSMATSSGPPVRWIVPWLMLCQLMLSRTGRRPGDAGSVLGRRKAEKIALSDLKPAVLTLATLLAITSSSRCSAVCRDRLMMRLFSIDSDSPGRRPPALPGRAAVERADALPSEPLGRCGAELVPDDKTTLNQCVE